MSEQPRLRVLAIASQPVQYAVPIFRLMGRHPRLDFQVAYCTLRGADAAHDSEFGITVRWDVPLLDGYEWTEVNNKGSGRESFWGLYNPGIWKVIRSGKFDAVLCYTGYLRATFWIAYFAAKLSGTAFLFGTDAVTLTPRDRRMWKRPVKRLLWRFLFRLADQVIVPSSGTRNLMLSLGLPQEQITLTPYVVDNEWWTAQSSRVDRAAVRTSWGAAPDDLVILFCAKLVPWKRPHDVLRAFAKARLSKGLLLFAGEGPLRTSLEKEAAELGIASRLRFLGFVNQSQLPAVYTSADIMVLSSEYEPFGVVVNEAMCCGCVVIVSDHVGAARDLVADGQTGFVYPCGDVERLAGILGQAAVRELSLSELSRAARLHMQSWSPTQNIDTTIEAVSCAVVHSGSKPVGFQAANPESPVSDIRRS
jgi:glycosyltransferase involved in cell wall biosynthesis